MPSQLNVSQIIFCHLERIYFLRKISTVIFTVFRSYSSVFRSLKLPVTRIERSQSCTSVC